LSGDEAENARYKQYSTFAVVVAKKMQLARNKESSRFPQAVTENNLSLYNHFLTTIMNCNIYSLFSRFNKSIYWKLQYVG